MESASSSESSYYPTGVYLLIWAGSGIVVTIGSVLTVVAQTVGSPADHTGLVWLTVGGLGVIIAGLKLTAEAVKALGPPLAEARKAWRAAAADGPAAQLATLEEKFRRSEETCNQTTKYLQGRVDSNEERITRLEQEVERTNRQRDEEYQRYRNQLILQAAEYDRVIELYKLPIRKRLVENPQIGGPEDSGPHPTV